jgi:flagellar basal body-associated protein FliL
MTDQDDDRADQPSADPSADAEARGGLLNVALLVFFVALLIAAVALTLVPLFLQ